MVAGDHKQPRAQAFQFPPGEDVAFGAAVIADIAGHQYRVDGADGRLARAERGDGLVQQMRSIESPGDQLPRCDRVKVREMQQPRHAHLIPVRRKACTNCR